MTAMPMDSGRLSMSAIDTAGEALVLDERLGEVDLDAQRAPEAPSTSNVTGQEPVVYM